MKISKIVTCYGVKGSLLDVTNAEIRNGIIIIDADGDLSMLSPLGLISVGKPRFKDLRQSQSDSEPRHPWRPN